MSYIGNSPGVASQRVETAFTATASQTVFTPSSGYTLGYCDVYYNGVKLVNGDDYTAADGVSITLATAAAAGDSVVVVASFPRGLSDGYLKAEADAKYVALTGDQTIAGVKTFSGSATIVNGNLGVGTSSVLGNSTFNAALGIAVRNQSTSMGYFQTYNANAGTDLKTWRFGGNGSGNLVFETVNDAYSSATGRLTLDSAGRVGLKVTPNTNWPSNWSVMEWIGNNNIWAVQGQMQVGYNNYYDGTNYRYGATGNRALRYIQTDSGHYWDTSASGTAGAAATFETQMQLGHQQTLALRGASPQGGTGITFPATQVASSDANTLDDYEEGEFTPTIGGISTAGTGTYSGQKGKYTKIGNRCLFQIWLDWTNISGAGGSMVVRGLPFTSSGGTYVYNNIASYMDRSIVLSANSVFQSYVIPGDTKIYLAQYAAGGGNAAGVTLDSDGAIMLTGSYEVA